MSLRPILFCFLAALAPGLASAQPDPACSEPATPIGEIQGEGDASPLAGSVRTVQAVVAGDFQDASLNGFFIQEEDADQDGNPGTSEGLFVFESDSTVAPGDVVRVTGMVLEFRGLTELTRVSRVVVCASGVQVTPAEIVLPLAGDLERLEGMAVVLPQELTVTESFGLGAFGEVVLSSGGRLLTPTHLVEPGDPARALQAENDRNRIILDDGDLAANPDPIPFPPPALSATRTLRVGDTVTGAAGVLSFGRSAFGNRGEEAHRVLITAPPRFVARNPRPDGLELPGSGMLRVAGANLLNYFNGDGQGGGFPTPRGADNRTEFERQRAKLINVLLTLNADVVGLIELENDGYGPDGAIQDLVNGLNAAVPQGTRYAFVDPGRPRLGDDEIAVGLIYRDNTVEPIGNAAVLDNNVDPAFNDQQNRPALAQTFREKASGETLTVAVNHLKSKGSDCDDLGDSDTGDGQGNCNLTRTAAAEALVRWLAADPTGSADADVLVVGDLNAYAREDPIAAIEAGGYVNLIARFGSDEAYSFVFRGQSGYLDHALASASLAPQVTAAIEWHVNADEPVALDYNLENKSPMQVASLFDDGPFRASDHDPVVVEIALGAPAAEEPRPQRGISVAGRTLEEVVDAAFESASLREIADAPVDALQGVSEADAARLERAFGVRTVRDLAELQFVRWAQAIVELAEAEE